MNSNIQLQGSWELLVTFLNSLGSKGKEKDIKSWKTTWRDLKCKVSDKTKIEKRKSSNRKHVLCAHRMPLKN